MKKDKTAPGSFKKIYRVDLQVFLMTAIIVVISCGITFVVSYCLTYNGMIRALRSRANSIYEYADGRLDVETFRGLNSRADGTSYLYQEAKKTLENVRTATGVRYLYTAKEKEDGTFIYLVDGLPVKSKDFRYIGDAIEPECIPDMKMAMENQVVLQLPKQATLYRTGGDEFTIILKEVPREHILEMIEKSCRRRRVDGLPADTEIQMSAGYAFYDEKTDASLEDTYKRADAQMYEQKKEKYRDKIFIGGIL